VDQLKVRMRRRGWTGLNFNVIGLRENCWLPNLKQSLPATA
jgi:hypothetical protein